MVLTNADFRRSLLGNGILRPLRRLSGSDFVSASGSRVVKAAIEQVIGTRIGELIWRPDFGTNIERFRHQNATPQTVAAIASEIKTSLSIWEPRVSVASVGVAVEDNQIRVKITWSLVVGRAINANDVDVGPFSTEVTI